MLGNNHLGNIFAEVITIKTVCLGKTLGNCRLSRWISRAAVIYPQLNGGQNSVININNILFFQKNTSVTNNIKEIETDRHYIDQLDHSHHWQEFSLPGFLWTFLLMTLALKKIIMQIICLTWLFHYMWKWLRIVSEFYF